MNIGEIIKQYRTERKLSMDNFSKQSGLTKGYISMLEKNEHPKSKKPIIPTEETIVKVAKGMNVEIDDILEKLDPNQEIQINLSPSDILGISNSDSHTSTINEIMKVSNKLDENRQLNVLAFAKTQYKKQNTAEDSNNTVEEPRALYTYNYYDQPASAGTGQYLNDVQVEQIELPVNVDADFVIPVYGDSMEPEYHSGDYVFVKLSVELSDGDIGVFEYCGDAYIKQLLLGDAGAFLHSLNSNYDDIPVDADSDFRIIGKVVDLYRG